jgi:hypothetical protein
VTLSEVYHLILAVALYSFLQISPLGFNDSSISKNFDVKQGNWIFSYFMRNLNTELVVECRE